MNVTQEFGAPIGNPQNHAGFKLSGGPEHVIVRRNYVNTCHGPGVWFDGWADAIDIYDNILVDCGINIGAGDVPGIFYEISYSHKGAVIRNNWNLGNAAHLRISHSHGIQASPILVNDNTFDSDASDRQGIEITDTQGRSEDGDSDGSTHPFIDTLSLPSGRHFVDFVQFNRNVIRKRNPSFNPFIPLAGAQHGSGTTDIKRNYEWNLNKYEVNSAITNGFRWDTGPLTFAQWQTYRAAQNDVQDAGPFFDAGGSFVTWSGTPQFANTPNNWENAAAPSGIVRIGAIAI